MGDNRDDLGWRPPVIFALFAVAAVIAYALWPSWQNYCPAKEELAECSRQWIGALSGWIAAAAAILAIGPLLGQLREQRRQTRFVLGDAEPTVDIERRAPLSLRVRIVNWNRRMLDIRAVKFRTPAGDISARNVLRRTETMGYQPYMANFFGLKVHGWEDRAERPPFNELAIELEDVTEVMFNGPLTVLISGELIGDGLQPFESITYVRPWGEFLAPS